MGRQPPPAVGRAKLDCVNSELFREPQKFQRLRKIPSQSVREGHEFIRAIHRQKNELGLQPLRFSRVCTPEPTPA
jgi:hypothetical protein